MDPLKLTLTIMSDRMSFAREYKLYKNTDTIFCQKKVIMAYSSINNLPTFLLYTLFIVGGYLSGSVLYGYVICKKIKKIDLYEISDDGNAGTANSFKYGGVAIGIFVLLCDLLKGFLPVFIASRFFEQTSLLFMPIVIMPVIGHAFPVFNIKKGGKCIAVSFGVLFGTHSLLPAGLILAAIYVFFSTFAVLKPHSFRTALTYLVWTLACFVFLHHPIINVICTAVTLLVILKHFKSLKADKKEVSFSFLFFGKHDKENSDEKAQNV